MEIIYESHGIEIISKDEKIFIRYDAGEFVHKIREIEISEKNRWIFSLSQHRKSYMITWLKILMYECSLIIIPNCKSGNKYTNRNLSSNKE